MSHETTILSSVTRDQAFASLSQSIAAQSPYGDEIPDVPLPPDLATSLADVIKQQGRTRCKYYAVDIAGQLYHYHDGVYETSNETTRAINRQVRNAKMGSRSSDCKEVVSYIRDYAPRLWTGKQTSRYLNLHNGILDLETRKLFSHTNKFLSSVQLPVSYDPNATCPRIEKFVSEVFPDDVTTLPWELVAWLIFPELWSIQSSLLLYGKERNGKSAWLGLVQAFIGKHNYSSQTLQQLSARFGSSHLIGKLANIHHDLPGTKIKSSSAYKAIVTHDEISYEVKYLMGGKFTPVAKLLFAANVYPTTEDTTSAFFRRWVVIPCVKTFVGKKDKRLRTDMVRTEVASDDLASTLHTPGELSGMLNKALAIKDNLKSRNEFEEPESIRRANLQFRRCTDPIETWLLDNTIQESGAKIRKADLYTEFRESTKDDSLPPITQNQFGIKVMNLAGDIVESQIRNPQGARERYYMNIDLVPDGFGD